MNAIASNVATTTDTVKKDAPVTYVTRHQHRTMSLLAIGAVLVTEKAATLSAHDVATRLGVRAAAVRRCRKIMAGMGLLGQVEVADAPTAKVPPATYDDLQMRVFDLKEFFEFMDDAEEYDVPAALFGEVRELARLLETGGSLSEPILLQIFLQRLQILENYAEEIQ